MSYKKEKERPKHTIVSLTLLFIARQDYHKQYVINKTREAIRSYLKHQVINLSDIKSLFVSTCVRVEIVRTYVCLFVSAFVRVFVFTY